MNTSWLLGGNVFRLIIGLLVGVLVARYLGPSRYGELNYAIAYTAIFGVLASMGLDNIVVRELVRSPDRRDEFLGTAAGLKLIGTSLMVAFILGSFLLGDSNTDAHLLIIVIAIGYFFQVANVVDWQLQAKVASKYSVEVQLLSVVVVSGMQLVGIWRQAPLLYFAAVSVVGGLVSAIGLFWVYRAKFGVFSKWKFRRDIARKLVRSSFPLMLSGFSIMIYMRIDQVMIQNMLGSEAVGHYSVAVRLSEAWYFIPTLIAGSLYPAIINAKQRSESEYNSRLQRLHNLLVLISVSVAVAVDFFSRPVINFLYGSAYMPAVPALNIYVWAGLFVAIGVASSRFLLVEEMHWRAFFRTFSGMVINVMLNALLIPHYGIKGAAFATLISYAFAGYIYDLFDGKCREMFMVKTRSLFGFWRLSA